MSMHTTRRTSALLLLAMAWMAQTAALGEELAGEEARVMPWDAHVAAREAGVLAARTDAQALARRGERWQAAQRLLTELRALDPADATQLDTAHGMLQALAFTTAGLMPDPELGQFLTTALHPDDPATPVDALALAAMRAGHLKFDTRRGLEMPAKAEVLAQVSALRESKVPLVRAGALFLHADPYLNEGGRC